MSKTATTKAPVSLFKANLFLKAYGIFKIPLLAYVSPKCVELSPTRSVIRIKLGRRSQNHLKVMYFGALGIGAELSIAITAVSSIYESGQRIDFIFKDFKAEFLKRNDGDVHFICDEADKVRALIEKATTTGERLEGTFKGYCTVPSKSETEKTATYELTLSVKNRSIK
ncbi:DUF4442 domain-containing protein [Bdellovibrio sp. HCB337]|uniref:DUF4442 domain-containing protein n=1 Tax=Bdellovibrio sp. HCB337 TaxID=3394358 RepID=UPI0039A582F5